MELVGLSKGQGCGCLVSQTWKGREGAGIEGVSLAIAQLRDTDSAPVWLARH